MEPIYELSARTLPTGGEVRGNDLPPLLIGQSQLTILIHGFNNDTEQASRSYARFLRETELRRHSLLAGRICVFFWPGDHGWYRYQDEIPRAIEAADVLRGYLEEIAAGQRIEVSLVCHSLGNRVALEFVARCLKTANLDVQVPRACLMAAAVPVEMVDSGGDLRDAAEHIDRRHALFSHSDLALGLVFQVGQDLAEKPTVGAVGKHGEPEGLWREAVDMTPYAHGDYWWEPESAAEARWLFGISASRMLPVRRRGISRLLPSFVGLPTRDVADRKMFPGLRGD